MIHPHFKIDEKWILTFLYIYRWNIDLKEKKDDADGDDADEG